MEASWHYFIHSSVLFVPKLLVAVVILVLFLLLALVCKAVLKKICRRIQKHALVLALLAKILQIVIIVIGLITAFGTIGINVTALVASLGLFGFAAGFAFKDLLSNTLAGVMILLYRPFVIGDEISGATFEGKVTDINLRYVVLQQESETVLIPNSLLLSNVLKVSSK